MTRPRPVFPGRFYFITRRCTQRQFLLRPDEETNNAFVYCLAEAAARFEVVVVLSQMMSNHHHTLIYDPHGREVEFREHLHKFVAKSQNALRGRWENLWAAEESCVVDVLELEDVLDKLVYIATNPVKDGLVEHVRHWPGPKFVQALLSGKPLRAHRPNHFFRSDGPMPESVELKLELPAHIEGHDSLLEELARRIAAVEEAHAKARLAAGRRVLGRRSVLRQSWRDSPTSHEPRRGLRPRVAARSKWARIAKLQRDKDFEVSYKDVRIRWLAGEEVTFPYGTYWLRRFAGVDVESPGQAPPRV
jgi:REP element-mobilizing transposase RayT